MFYIFSRSIAINAKKLDKLMKNPFVDWFTALRNFNDHKCKHDAHIASLLIALQVFVSQLENEINPISHTQYQLLDTTVSKSRENSSIVNTSCCVEGIAYHLEATYVIVAMKNVSTFKHYLILNPKFVISSETTLPYCF